MTFDPNQMVPLIPMLVLIGMGCVVLLAETFVAGKSREGLVWLSVAGCLATLVALVFQWEPAVTRTTVLQGMWVLDRMSIFIDGAFVLTALITVLLSGPYLREHGFEAGEFYALVLFGAGGMIMVAHADHLLALLIGIETMSLAAYVLTGSWRRSARSSEGALKYFLMGAFATGFLVYGMALVYGLTGGELSYAGIAAKAKDASASPLFLVGFYFILATFVFKVAAVPFHFWAPDAYEGAPTPATGFMAAGVKAAAFVGLVRLLGTVFGGSALSPSETGWVPVISLIAIVTMTYGNLAAIRQDNIKRMMAYSSVAHAGYLLVGVAAVGLGVPDAQASVLFYLAAYTFTTLGTFGVIAWVGRRGDERLFVDDWAGPGHGPTGAGAGDDRVPAVPGRGAPDGRVLREVLSVPVRHGTAGTVPAGHRRRAEQRDLDVLLPAGGGRDVLPRSRARAPAVRGRHHARGPGGQRPGRRAPGRDALRRRGMGRRRRPPPRSRSRLSAGRRTPHPYPLPAARGEGKQQRGLGTRYG